MSGSHVWHVYETNLKPGEYTLSFHAETSSSNESTGFYVFSKTGGVIAQINAIAGTTEYSLTFNVDENFAGFGITWVYGDYTVFSNIALNKTG